MSPLDGANCSATSFTGCACACTQGVHPFQFKSGQYTDDLYEAEVRVCARGFVGDHVLKAKVSETAARLFSRMPVDAGDFQSEIFQLYGITFCVKCIRPSLPVGRKTGPGRSSR